MSNYSCKFKILFSPEGVGQTEDKGQEYLKAKREKKTSIARQVFPECKNKIPKTSMKQAVVYEIG